MADDLMKLAELCEAATGPDRKLDKAIAVALGLRHGRESGWCNSENGDHYVIDECAERFSASLDAATTLVPEGCEWRIERRVGKGMHPAYASIWATGARDIDFHANAHGKSVALALCAAALRSRAAATRTNLEEGDGE